MEIRQPKSEQEFSTLLRLLQDSLRPTPSPFPIADEYPIMLKGSRAHSYCVFDGNKPIAHAHLWSRLVRHPGENVPTRVGLIGNVATDATRRGEGLMRQLLQELEQRAHAMDLKMLILWSDLDQFYQNLGYASLGEEIRFQASTISLAHHAEGLDPFVPIHADDLSNQQLAELLDLRPKNFATIERSAAEFRELLSIPATELLVSKAGERINGYAVMGKGMDMWGVIHEWGCTNPKMLVRAAYDVGRQIPLNEIMLLTPAYVATDWIETLVNCFEGHEKVPMAWGKTLANGEPLSSLFIWGLDSI